MEISIVVLLLYYCSVMLNNNSNHNDILYKYYNGIITNELLKYCSLNTTKIPSLVMLDLRCSYELCRKEPISFNFSDCLTKYFSN